MSHLDDNDVITFKIAKKALIDLAHLWGDEVAIDAVLVLRDELRMHLKALRETGAFDKRVEELKAELERQAKEQR